MSGTEMQLLDEAPVLASEIDSLGHMNVRFYLSRVDRANSRLVQALGLNITEGPNTRLRRYDTYSRFAREQFADAHLQVHGGVLELDTTQMRCYFEIRNPAKQEMAASFITVSHLIDPQDQRQLPFPQRLEAATDLMVQLPEYSVPRSLTLDPPRTDISLATLESRVPAEPTPGMMSGRRESTVDAEDCDEYGRLREDVDLMFVMHKPQPGEQTPSFGPPVMKTPEGHRFSWAMIETRAVVLGRPSAGDRLVSIGADIAFGQKWRQSRRWAYIEDSGKLVGVNDVVGIALDLDARRSIAIPDDMRETIEQNYLPDLM